MDQASLSLPPAAAPATCRCLSGLPPTDEEGLCERCEHLVYFHDVPRGRTALATCDCIEAPKTVYLKLPLEKVLEGWRGTGGQLIIYYNEHLRIEALEPELTRLRWKTAFGRECVRRMSCLARPYRKVRGAGLEPLPEGRRWWRSLGHATDLRKALKE